jgi:hypothetical protein
MPLAAVNGQPVLPSRGWRMVAADCDGCGKQISGRVGGCRLETVCRPLLHRRLTVESFPAAVQAY